MLARDINDAITSYNPATGFTPDKGTQQTDEDLERAGVPTINVVERMAQGRRVGRQVDRGNGPHHPLGQAATGRTSSSHP